MKAISFLGLGNYEVTTFEYRGDKCRTCLFPVALCHFHRPAELLVMVTEQAKKKWFDKLKEELQPTGIVPEPVDIPEGHSIDDLWTIFHRLTDHLEEEEELLFDITYSFRTLPFLAFLAASYLRVVKRVNLKGVFYGAWEARQPQSKPALPTDLSPVFDLSPFTELLSLTAATDQFVKTGSAESLALLLRRTDSSSPLADSLMGIAQGLHLLRPAEVMKGAEALPNLINKAVPAVSETTPPIVSLIQRVNKEYGTFGLSSATDFNDNAKAALVRQLRMVKWYADKGQFVHALSMAREWIPSLLCWHFAADPMDVREREDMELLLRGGVDKDRTTDTIVKQSPRLSEWEMLDNARRKKLTNLWGGTLKLAHLRNDVLHSGFRKNPRTAQEIADDTRKVVEELKAIADNWNLEN